ncbi:hypothetical protein LTR94_030192, partial [Friedmanniomyces endolithicus]
PGDSVQEAIRAANAAGATKTFRLVFGEAADIAPETYTFDAFVSSYGVPRGPIEGKLAVPDGITQRLRLVTEGGAGDGQALAELLEIATGGDVIANDLMEQVVGIEAALIPLHAAWTLARLGP